jgi:hypothetical protein
MNQIVIHGKSYKPGVEYLDGSYSLLIGHFVEELGYTPVYIDALLTENTVITEPSVFLLAHSASTTYKYTGTIGNDLLYCAIPNGSIVVDPWRNYKNEECMVIHYGNTRLNYDN